MYRRKFLKVMALSSGLAGLALAGLPTLAAQAAAETSSIPTATKISSMPVYAQQHHLSCEYSATRAAVARWGVQLTEAAFIKAIPVDDNPHLGFRGNIDASWGGTINYGIYTEPIARYLKTQGFNTKLLWNGLTSLKEEISYGRPVVVIVIGSMSAGTAFAVESEGVSFKLAAGEHAMTIYGYDAAGVYAANPGYGTYDYYSWAAFSRSWSVLGNMAMSVWPASQGNIAGETPGIDPEFYRYWLNNSGMELSGQPLALSAESNGKLSQYFERTRLEWDSRQPVAGQTGRGLLGTELTATRRAEAPFKALSATEIAGLSQADKTNLFGNTNFYIDQDFAVFWQGRGGLSFFGYPISRPFTENGLKVQYFERARLELHTRANGQTSSVLCGLLGQERLAQL